MFDAFDHTMMAHAIRLGEQARGLATPNPHVGCVIVKHNKIIGEGCTQLGGRPHAEAEALARCSESPKGATVYTSLEPCSLHAASRGPACSDLLAAAQVARVVSAMHDPFHGVDGNGHQRLQEAGIQVESGLMEAQARSSLRGFFCRVTNGRPWVCLKIASSIDGGTALADGESKWITGDEARRDVHQLRARACAVMTGIGTVMADDPQLNVRDIACERQPLRIVLDTSLTISDDRRILSDDNILIVTTNGQEERQRELESRGISVLCAPLDIASGKIDLVKTMQLLGSRGLNEILVEAGATLNGALLKAGVVDEIVVYLAPKLMGDSARGWFVLGQPTSLQQLTHMKWCDIRRVGNDLRVTAEPIEEPDSSH